MCKIALYGIGGPSILLIQPPSRPSTISVSTPIKLVVVGFSHTFTEEDARIMSYQPEYREQTVEEGLRSEALFMATELADTFGPLEVREWRKMEAERGALFEEFPYLSY